MRQKFVVGNWKMHTTAVEAGQLAKAVVDGVGVEDRIAVVICPPFPYLAHVGEIVKGSRIALGAQNLFPEKDGAFTGEVSPGMLVDVGCKYVILGHSERRHKLGESDAFINQKVAVALGAGLDVILCVGETLDQRKANPTEALLDRHLTRGLAGISRHLRFSTAAASIPKTPLLSSASPAWMAPSSVAPVCMPINFSRSVGPQSLIHHLTATPRRGARS